MEREGPEDAGGLAEGLRVGARFMLTLGVAGLGVVAAVALAGREAGPLAPPSPAAVPAVASVGAEQNSGFPLPGTPVAAAYLFIVDSEAARLALQRALESEALVRVAVEEPTRVSSVMVASSDVGAAAIIEAMQREASIVPSTTLLVVEVIELR